MNRLMPVYCRLASVVPLALLLLSTPNLADAGELLLTSANEVPPVTTAASGAGTITVTPDGAVSCSVKTTGIVGTMAHIHMAPTKGQNGPVIIPLTQSSPDTWSVPVGAKLTLEQMKAYMDGDLYVNVHSSEHKAGEIRAALTP